MAEIEISAIDRQCQRRRLATIEDVQHELPLFTRRKKIKISWTFNRKDAKRDFPELYRK